MAVKCRPERTDKRASKTVRVKAHRRSSQRRDSSQLPLTRGARCFGAALLSLHLGAFRSRTFLVLRASKTRASECRLKAFSCFFPIILVAFHRRTLGRGLVFQIQNRWGRNTPIGEEL